MFLREREGPGLLTEAISTIETPSRFEVEGGFAAYRSITLTYRAVRRGCLSVSLADARLLVCNLGRPWRNASLGRFLSYEVYVPSEHSTKAAHDYALLPAKCISNPSY